MRVSSSIVLTRALQVFGLHSAVRAIRWWRRPSLVESRVRNAVPVTVPMILISQMQRSGGTLLDRLFDGHSECFSHPHEFQWASVSKGRSWPRFEETGTARAAMQRFREQWVEKALLRGYYSKDPRGNGQRHPFLFDTRVFKAIFQQRYAESPPVSQREVFDIYLTAFFNAWLDNQNLYAQPKRYVTGFQPGVHLDPNTRNGFWRDYPDGYFISSVRDPVSWVASATSFQKTHKRTFFDSTEGAVETWIRSTEASLAVHDEHPERTVVVLFHDLINDTEVVMRRICEITGLCFQPILLEPTFNGRPIRSNSSFSAKLGIDRSVTDRSGQLTPDDVARIEELAGPLYATVRARFGLTPGDRERLLADVAG